MPASPFVLFCHGAIVTRGRWLVSVLVALHLVALAVSSVPTPDELRLGESVPPGYKGAFPLLASALDKLAVWLRAVDSMSANLLSPLRIPTDTYASLGLRQRWDMFSNPPTFNQYVRVDQYVTTTATPGTPRVVRELALPAQREDRIRLVHKFRDKAVMNALEAFVIAQRTSGDPAEPRSRALQPLATYFRNRLQREYLNDNEHVERTEVWFGQAAIPPPGEVLTTRQLDLRLTALERYWYGPSEVGARERAQPGTLQQEDTILWKLEYIDGP